MNNMTKGNVYSSRSILTISFIFFCFFICQNCAQITPKMNKYSKKTPQNQPSQEHYRQGKLTLKTNQVLFILGQDLIAAEKWTHKTNTTNSALSTYVSVDGTGAFARIDLPHGTLDLPQYIEKYSDSALSIGLWMVGYEKSIALNKSSIIKPLTKILTTLKNSNRPIYLRIGYEVDAPWNHYKPHYFIQSWRWIAEWIKEHQANNIATVWHIAAYCGFKGYGDNTYKGLDYDAWWPGSQYVDWVGFSYYQQLRDCKTFSGQRGLPFQFGNLNEVDTANRSQALELLMNYLKSKKKPIMIAESAPSAYHLKNTTYKKTAYVHRNDIIKKSSQDIWNEWFDPYFDFIERHRQNIRAVTYLSTPWDELPGWQCQPGPHIDLNECSQGYWGNSDIFSNAFIQQAFLDRLHSSIYHTTTDSNQTHLFNW